jgi:hypothetical protein
MTFTAALDQPAAALQRHSPCIHKLSVCDFLAHWPTTATRPSIFSVWCS